jgi:hypothetical protein
MTQRMTARLILCALGLALAACSLAGPSPRSFVPAKPGEAKLEAEPKDAKATEPKDAKAKDSEAKEPKVKGHKSKEAKAKAAAAKAGQTPLEAASEACKTTARDKGIKSLLSIVTHMRPGAVDADYVACMKEKGYEVAK